MKRLVILSAAFLLSVAFVVPRVSFAQTATDIQSQINALLAEIQVLQGELPAQGGSVPAFCYTFASNLSIGQNGAAVTALQTALQKDGESVSVTGTFDDQTASAVTGFQEKYASAILAPYDLVNGTGYVGSATRAELNSLFGCGTTTIPTSSTGSGQNGSPTIVPVTVTSPSAGQSFAQGSTMSIQWTPASGGVAQIQLVSTSGGESPFIYGEKVFGDPVDYSGYYSFLVSAGIPIGSYYVRLINPENDNAATPSVIGQSGVFAVTVAVPVVTSVVSPGMISPGYGAFVAGTNLPMQNATIVIDTGTAIAQTVTPTSYNSGFSLGFLLPAGILAGSHSIEVQSNGVTSNSVIFTVVAPPSVSQVNPTTVTPGATVTVSGQNFDGNSYVSLGNVPTGPENLPVAATSYTATSLTFVVPSNLASGVFPLYVAEHNSSLVSNQVSITISPSSNTSNLPTISSISPNQGTANTSVTVYGTNFTADGHQAVQFYASNGTLAGTVNFIDMSYISSQSMTFNLGTLSPGTYQVQVVTAAGASNEQSFTLTSSPVAPTPTITVTSPTAGTTVTQGNNNNLTATWTGGTPTVNINLFQNGQFLTPIVVGDPNTGQFTWGFETPYSESGSGYQIQIASVGVSPGYSGLSGSFNVAPATQSTPAQVTVTSPVAGQTFAPGSVMTVQWTPVSPSVTEIDMVPTDGSYPTHGTWLYRLGSGSGYPGPSLSYEFGSPLPSNIPPGSYYIAFYSSGALIGQSGTFTVAAPQPSAPAASISASPTSITAGQSTTLTWSSTGATSCIISGTDGYNDNTGWSKLFLASSGSLPATPYPSSQSSYAAQYEVSCTGSGGTSSPASVTVTVNPAPVIVQSAPAVSLSPTSMAFSLPAGSNSPSPASSYTTFIVSPNQSVNWTASPSASWIVVSPSGSAQTGGTASVSINAQAAASLSSGTHTGTVTFSPASGSTSFTPQMVSVTLTVTPVIAPAANIYDVNGDGVVNMLDYQVELAAALGTNTTCGLKCDLNGDGQVNVVDLQRMTNYLLSIGINPSQSASVPSAALSINDSPGGQSFTVGQSWTLSLSSTGVPSTPFSFCYQNTPPGGSAGAVSCTPAGFGTTDANGNWTLSGSFATSTVGSDAEWVTFSSPSLSSNHITFTVTNPGVGAATGNQSQLATVFLSLAGLIHSLSSVIK